jgi:hypothetical protein
MHRTLFLGGALAAALSAQSPLTTTFTGSTFLGVGTTVYFDLVVNVPLTLTQIDVNSNSPANTNGTVEVRFLSGTYVGNDTNPAAWTFGGSGPVVTAGTNQPTVCTLSPFTLPPGNYGIAVTHVGFQAFYGIGNGTTVPGSGTNQTYTNTELTMLCGATAGPPFGTAICCQPRFFSGSLHYVVASGGTVATRTSYGAGCYRRMASVYELFATSAAFDLGNSSISFLGSGTGYTVVPGLATFVAPSASATVLTLSDDTETTVTLGAPFPYAGGATTSLTVCSNGFVSVASGNGTTFTPVATTMLAAPQTAWWNWHDYNPAITTGGRVKFEEIAGIAYVTWDGVFDFGGASAANANTFQFQFDLTSGFVHLVFQTMSALGNARLVGFSPGGPSLDPGSTDLSSTLPATIALSAADVQALALGASARPLIGTTIQLQTSNPTSTGLGVVFLGLTAIPIPGFDLGVIGAPGCPALVDVTQAFGSVIGNLPGLSMDLPLVLPNDPSLAGLHLFAQSVWLDAVVNVAGLLTSNGLELVVGNV